MPLIATIWGHPDGGRKEGERRPGWFSLNLVNGDKEISVIIYSTPRGRIGGIRMIYSCKEPAGS
jgi:hypothetical protein